MAQFIAVISPTLFEYTLSKQILRLPHRPLRPAHGQPGVKKGAHTMTYEKDNIPDFALVPARQPEERVLIPVTQGAVFSPLQITNVTEKSQATISLEEDVLVPDTRPDLKDILEISGKVRLASREFEPAARSEDSIPISGEVEIQALYTPERAGVYGPVIAIASRIAFREPWHTSVAPGSVLTMEAHIDSMDYMVINERKFRVKIVLSIQAREYHEQKLEIFEGITGEGIQALHETVEITNTALRKKDIITIKEDLEGAEIDGGIDTLLRQDIHVAENYRQAAAEKVVINGFIYVNLLYTAANMSNSDSGPSLDSDWNPSRSPVSVSGAALESAALSAASQSAASQSAASQSAASSGHAADALHQLQTRVEFTQFIPLSQNGHWSGSHLSFDGSDLRVRQVTAEDGSQVLRLEGDIITWVELYRNVEKEIMVDAYHREKDFVCDFEEVTCRTLMASATGEATVREVLSLDSSHGPADQIVYVSAEVSSAESRAEAGKIITEGSLEANMLCRAEDPEASTSLFTIRHKIPFRCITATPQLAGGEKVRHRIYLKDFWTEKSGSHQAELNATVLVCAEAMRCSPLKILKHPAFEEIQGGSPDRKPMVVYIVKDGDTLWSVARHFKSTVDSIAQINQTTDGQLASGQKLLILR